MRLSCRPSASRRWTRTSSLLTSPQFPLGAYGDHIRCSQSHIPRSRPDSFCSPTNKCVGTIAFQILLVKSFEPSHIPYHVAIETRLNNADLRAWLSPQNALRVFKILLDSSAVAEKVEEHVVHTKASRKRFFVWGREDGISKLQRPVLLSNREVLSPGDRRYWYFAFALNQFRRILWKMHALPFF